MRDREREREREKERERKILQGHTPNDLRPIIMPASQRFLPSSNSAKLRTKPLIHRPLRVHSRS
jgi:hypothetical protein